MLYTWEIFLFRAFWSVCGKKNYRLTTQYLAASAAAAAAEAAAAVASDTARLKSIVESGLRYLLLFSSSFRLKKINTRTHTHRVSNHNDDDDDVTFLQLTFSSTSPSLLQLPLLVSPTSSSTFRRKKEKKEECFQSAKLLSLSLSHARVRTHKHLPWLNSVYCESCESCYSDVRACLLHRRWNFHPEIANSRLDSVYRRLQHVHVNFHLHSRPFQLLRLWIVSCTRRRGEREKRRRNTKKKALVSCFFLSFFFPVLFISKKKNEITNLFDDCST